MTRTLRLASPLLALLLAAPASAQTITGRILPPAGGKAVAPDKIQVELISLTPDFRQAVRRFQGGPPVLAATARPRPDGSFAIAAPEPGLYRVTVRADGFVPLRYDLSPLVEETELPPVELQPASRIEVQVLGPDGKPVPAVPVQTVPLPEPGEPRPDSSWQPAGKIDFTGADGRVTVPSVPGARLWVLALATRSSFSHAEVREGPVTLRLKAARRLDLEVRDARGKKVAGALVRLARFQMPLGLTGPDGRLSLPLEEDLHLVVETEDGQTAAFRLAADTPSPREVELERPMTVSGKVLAAAGRAPVSGALVWGDHGMLSLRPARAAADGRFQIQVSGDLPEAGLLAAAPGYLPEQSTVSPRSREGDVPAPVTLLLASVGAITGRVVDAGGRPVSEAEIRIGGFGRFSGELAGLQLQSGRDGSFRLPRLQAGETYELQVRKTGFAPASVSAKAAPMQASAAPVRIVLSRGGAVFGRTVGPDGEPVAGVTLELRPWQDPMRGGMRSDEPATGTATSGTDGKFEVRHLPPGVFVLQARLDGFAPGVLNGVEVPAGTPRVDAGDVTLSPEAVITGQVTDPRGAPIAGAQVWATPDRGRGFETDFRPLETGTDGRFRIAGLPRGAKVRVGAQAQGYGEADLEGLEPPLPEPLHIELRPLVHLTGRVSDPAGEPVPGAYLSLIKRHAGGSSGSGLGNTDGQGRFRIGVEPGPVEIAVHAQGFTDGSWSGTVPERGETSPVEITLGRGAVLEGRVLDPAGDPVTEAFVWAFPEEPSAADRLRLSGRAQSDGEGRYRIAGLGTGPYRVNVQTMESMGETSSRFEVQPGSNRLDLTLDSGVEVSGLVRDADGAPVAGAEVTLSTKDAGRSIGRQSAADGSFQFRTVTDGSYRITARHRASGFGQQEVEVAGRAIQGLDLRLGPAGAITGRLLGLEPADLTGVRVGARAAFREEPATVRPDGTYRIPGLPPGEWEVFAELPSGRRAEGRVRLEPDVPEAVLDLDLGGDLSLSGVVRIDGAPRSGVRLSLQSRDAGSRSAEASTSLEGTFRMTRLASGEYLWSLYDQERALSLRRLVELSTDLETAVEITTGTVRGQVLSPEGAPVADASVSLEGTYGDWTVSPYVRVDRQGRFELRLPAGEYRIFTSTDGFPHAGNPFRVPARGVATVQVVLEPAVR